MKIGYFEDLKNGNIVKSSIRLQMFLTMFYSFFIIAYQLYADKVDIVLDTLLLTAAFVPKVVSKFAENINHKQPDETK